jgi:hypothetical protein
MNSNIGGKKLLEIKKIQQQDGTDIEGEYHET